MTRFRRIASSPRVAAVCLLAAAMGCCGLLLAGSTPATGVGLGLSLLGLGWALGRLPRPARGQRLEASGSDLRAMLDLAGDAVIEMDASGAVVAWSPAAESLFGWPAGEAIGRPLAELIVPPRDRDTHQSGLRRYGDAARSRRVGRRTEVVAVRRDGSEFPIEVTIAPYRGLHGLAFAARLRDVTETRRSRLALSSALDDLDRKSLELTVARDAAANAARAKAQLLANMSHEIRTPMNGVLGVADLLLQTELTGEQRELTSIIRDSGQALLGVINDILDFSRCEARKVQLEPIELDPRAVIEEVAELLAEKAQGKRLELITDTTSDLPATLVGDPGRLRQVLVNLVGNAVKFTERGEVVVWAGVIHRAAERVLFRVAVRDTGIGIAPEAREHLFQSFMQADGSMTRRYGGTGLGLAISKELVALMGGDIGCDSRPGHGSEFWFTAWLGVPAGAACASPVEPRWNGRKALIVEDSAAASEVLERSLRQWGMETRSVSDPGAALETLRAVAAAGAAYDVAFLDLELLESRGAEFLRQVRGDPLLAALRTILCRPAGPGSPATKAIEAEAAQVLSKPIRRRQLQACLDSCFQVEPRTAGGAPGPDAGRPAAPAGAARETRGAVGLRILVADDMADNRRLLQLYLKRLGCDAETVADGAAVLRATEEAPFDVILLDCHMPEVDGFEATRRLREREAAVGPGAHRTTIVAVTALALPGDRERCLAAGMDECLCKPVRFAELAAVIESRVGAHGAA